MHMYPYLGTQLFSSQNCWNRFGTENRINKSLGPQQAQPIKNHKQKADDLLQPPYFQSPKHFLKIISNHSHVELQSNSNCSSRYDSTCSVNAVLPHRTHLSEKASQDLAREPIRQLKLNQKKTVLLCRGKAALNSINGASETEKRREAVWSSCRCLWKPPVFWSSMAFRGQPQKQWKLEAIVESRDGCHWCHRKMS